MTWTDINKGVLIYLRSHYVKTKYTKYTLAMCCRIHLKLELLKQISEVKKNISIHEKISA